MHKYVASSILLNALYTEISEMSTMISSTPTVSKASIEGISIPVKKEVSGLTNGDGSRTDLRALLDNIKHDCISVPCTLKDGLRISAEAVKEDTDSGIYGIIWASKENPNFRINVLHPIVVQSLLSGEYNDLIKYESEGTLYIYEYKYKHTKKFNDSFAEVVIDRWVEILSVLSTEAYVPNTTLRCSTNLGSLCGDIRRGSISLENARVQFSESGDNPNKVITPTMFVTSGMLFPYYGAVQSRHSGGSYESRDLMHFGSCNLDHRRDIGGWGGTCTGKFSNNIYASLRVLTNLNTASAHHTDVISKECDILTYVKVAQELSIQVIIEHFKDEWGITEVIAEEPIEVTPEVVVVSKKRGRPSKKVEVN